MRVIEHFCPSVDCSAALRTTVVPAPAASLGSVPAPVRCPQCGIGFGLWVPLSQAPYVRFTELADPVQGLVASSQGGSLGSAASVKL